MLKLVLNLLGLMTARQKIKYYGLQVLVVITAVCEVLSIAAIGPFMALVGDITLIDNNPIINSIYNYSGINDRLDFLFVMGLGIFLFLVISAIVSILTISKLSVFAANTGAEFGNTLYDYYLRQDCLYHSEINSAVLIKQIATEVTRVTDNILQPFVQINARIFAVLLISASVFVYDPVISVVGLLILCISYYSLFYTVRDKLAENGNNITSASKQRFKLMNEGFSAIKEIHVLGRISSYSDAFQESGRVFSKAYGSSNGLYNAPRYLIELIVYSGMIGLILILVRLYDGDLSTILPVMSVFGIAAFKLLPSFQQMYSGAAQIRGNLSAFYSIQKDLLNARSNSYKNNANKPCNESMAGNISLSAVSFRYPGKKEDALKKVDLSIPENKIIGLVGPSGSGKSTILDILLGVMKPTNGHLTVGENIINDENVRVWQNNIGYVPQQIFLKDGSILENVAFGLSGFDIELDKVERAIKFAQLDEWIKSLPEGLLTEVGERGVQLSGGQRQRIGIARALYDDAKVLLFDEATSALDGVTENLIMNSILKFSQQKTIVMIAHRLNTIKDCDIIYFIENGCVVDKGNYSFLLKNNNRFKQMVGGFTK